MLSLCRNCSFHKSTPTLTNKNIKESVEENFFLLNVHIYQKQNFEFVVAIPLKQKWGLELNDMKEVKHEGESK